MRTLLKVPQKAQYGLMIVSELAPFYQKGEMLSLEQIAEKAGASRKFLEQIAADLRKAGLIEGRRGAAGGYILNRDPSLITVAEVLQAVGGPMAIESCTAHQVRSQPSGVRSILDKVQGQVVATLTNTTIEEITRVTKE